MRRLTIDQDVCQGHGRCYALYPGLFDCDESGYGEVIVDAVEGAALLDAEAAVAACPEFAISLEDATS